MTCDKKKTMIKMVNQDKVEEPMVALYQRRAGNYDLREGLYRLIGFREWKYRKMVIEALGLQPGDTVVEIGCGTGLNFSLLEQVIGPEGRIVGVDLTDAMLDQARKRIVQHGWSNIELVSADASNFEFRVGVDGIIPTFAITLIPNYDQVIHNGARVLAPGKRWVILDLKRPDYLPSWLASLVILLIRPFIISDEYLTRRPWVSIGKYLQNPVCTEFDLKFAYIAVDERV